MNLLTENIRWVASLTLEGDRLSADDIVVRRAMVAGARIDTLGVRLSFVVAAGLFLTSLVFSVSSFVATFQFFQPDYTVFALSLLPLIGFGVVAFRLRPRQHFTLLLQDGSAIGLISRDGNFLTRCLEAFERLWADPARSSASLYLHAQHRSVDFGPAKGGIDVVPNPQPSMGAASMAVAQTGSALPPFVPVPEAAAVPASPPVDMPPVRAADDEELEALIPRRRDEEDEPHLQPEPQPQPEPEQDVQAAAFQEPSLDHLESVRAEVFDADLPEMSDDEADEPPLPPLPPPMPTDEFPPVPAPVDPDDDLLVPMADEPHDHDAKGQEEADAEAEVQFEEPEVDAHSEPEPEPELEPEPEPEPEPAPEPVPKMPLEELEDLPLPEEIEAIHFADIRPKVEALVRLLRERAPSQGIGDAVDVLEMMTRRGCRNEREVRALARSVEVLRERMHAYPTAVELMDDVRRAGLLPPSPKPRAP